MRRTLIRDFHSLKEKKVLIKGRVQNIREMGGVSFIIVADYTGVVQSVWNKKIEAKIGEVVSLVGMIKREERAPGGFEIEGDKLEIISKNLDELPFDITKPNLDLQLSTLLDNRTLSLRHPKIQAIFKLYNIVLEAYGIEMRKEGFTEIKTPKLLGAASEGGANFFTVEYFEKKSLFSPKSAIIQTDYGRSF